MTFFASHSSRPKKTTVAHLQKIRFAAPRVLIAPADLSYAAAADGDPPTSHAIQPTTSAHRGAAGPVAAAAPTARDRGPRPSSAAGPTRPRAAGIVQRRVPIGRGQRRCASPCCAPATLLDRPDEAAKAGSQNVRRSDGTRRILCSTACRLRRCALRTPCSWADAGAWRGAGALTRAHAKLRHNQYGAAAREKGLRVDGRFNIFEPTPASGWFLIMRRASHTSGAGRHGCGGPGTLHEDASTDRAPTMPSRS